MKNLFFLLLCAHLFCAGPLLADDRFIDAFPIVPGSLHYARLAQPGQYFDKVGPRAAALGVESGQFEAWIWPWKPLRNFDLQFYLGNSTQPISSRELVRTIDVTPEVTTFTFTHEAFTVKEHILVPRSEPAILILLEVQTVQPLAIVPGFIPVMQPMWPAGVGGQFSYWDDEAGGYVISEGQWRAEFICGSPAGRQMTSPPAHMFADNPIEFRIDLKPGDADGKFIPIVIAGALPDSASGKMKFDSVKATFRRTIKRAEQIYRDAAEYYRALQSSTVQVRTGDAGLDQAVEWGKVALDNLLIDNPKLGHGMVAGYGLSGGGGRPGFAWFFGGDAFINVLAMNSVGMYRQSRDALAFTQKWQRRENFPVRKKNPADPPTDVGKMAHELSQSDGIVDWWNDYHYGYNHADTSPWYIVAMGDYVRTSGDTAFLRTSWESLRQAYNWCLSKDSDGDGLMDLKGAGLGALEFGKLVGIYADVYTCGVWVQAIREMQAMAERLGDGETARQAAAQFERARPRLEKLFWLDKERFYSYGATAGGEQVKEKTPWSGVAMMYGLLEEDHVRQSLEAMNGMELCTDWGVRSLSNSSSLFEPSNYNYGAVWPFISSFFVTAQFLHGYDAAGYDMLQATISHVYDHALGVVPEVFSGQSNEKLAEGYHHQGFSTTGYLLPLMRGLLGLDVDALNHTVTVAPRYRYALTAPLALDRIVCGGDTLSVERTGGASPAIVIRRHGNQQSTVRNLYSMPMRARKDTAAAGFDGVGLTVQRGNAHLAPESRRGDVVTFGVTASCDDSARIDLRVPPPIEFTMLRPSWPPLGVTNRGPRLLSQSFEKNILKTDLEGLTGDSCRFLLSVPPEEVLSVKGGTLDGSIVTVRIGRNIWPGSDYVQKTVTVMLKPRE